MSVATQPPMPGQTPLEMPRARHRLEPGDRFPDFVLADQTGTVRAFNQRVHGLAMAVFLDTDDALRSSLRGLAEGYRSAELECVAIDASAQGADPWPTILADEAGRIRQSLREMSGRPSGSAVTRPLGFLLDRNQRILALTEEGDLGQWALARWSAEAAPAPAAEIRQAAPILTVPNVLTREDCRALIARWHEMGHEHGDVAGEGRAGAAGL
jgi:hypothetical protein